MALLLKKKAHIPKTDSQNQMELHRHLWKENHLWKDYIPEFEICLKHGKIRRKK